MSIWPAQSVSYCHGGGCIQVSIADSVGNTGCQFEKWYRLYRILNKYTGKVPELWEVYQFQSDTGFRSQG